MTLVRYEAAAGVATLTLDSPANRNALSSALVASLLSGLATAGADPSVRAVVLTHTGRTFCAGADLSSDSSGSLLDRTQSMVTLLRALLVTIFAESPEAAVSNLLTSLRLGSPQGLAESKTLTTSSSAELGWLR